MNFCLQLKFVSVIINFNCMRDHRVKKKAKIVMMGLFLKNVLSSELTFVCLHCAKRYTS
jgi:hypothetical protein